MDRLGSLCVYESNFNGSCVYSIATEFVPLQLVTIGCCSLHLVPVTGTSLTFLFGISPAQQQQWQTFHPNRLIVAGVLSGAILGLLPYSYCPRQQQVTRTNSGARPPPAPRICSVKFMIIIAAGKPQVPSSEYSDSITEEILSGTKVSP